MSFVGSFSVLHFGQKHTNDIKSSFVTNTLVSFRSARQLPDSLVIVLTSQVWCHYKGERPNSLLLNSWFIFSDAVQKCPEWGGAYLL